METQTITLRFDNYRRKDGINKLTIAKSDIPYLETRIENFMNWRGPTKKYKSVWQRFVSQGSCNFDKILNYLIDTYRRKLKGR